MPVVRKPFGQLGDGRDVNSILLTGPDRRLCVEILEFGATIRAITLCDRQGNAANVVLSYPTMGDYEAGRAYLGATVGRCTGRTSGRHHPTLRLSHNEGNNHLHGGSTGVSYSLWDLASIDDGDVPGVRLRRHSPAGEDGYPGNLVIDAEFSLAAPSVLRVVIQAHADADTPLNMTLHPYFNFNADPSSTVENHLLRIDADAILELDAASLPTGDLVSVQDTPFDFRSHTSLGQSLEREHAQLRLVNGHDHYYVLNGSDVAADVYSPSSLLGMRMYTNQKGLQFYSGNHLGKAAPFRPRNGFCLEPQGFPNAIHEARFPDITLHAGEVYRHETVYEFYTQGDDKRPCEGRQMQRGT